MGNTRNLGDLLNADSTIATADVADGGITTAKLADTAVTTAKITDANITTAKLASNAVTTAKITDGNISTAKLADDAVTQDKIGADAVGTNELANDVSISTSGAIVTTGDLTVDTNVLKVDSANNAVGIGITNPASYSEHADELVVGGSDGNRGITIVGGDNDYSILNFNRASNTSTTPNGALEYNHDANQMYLKAGASGTAHMYFMGNGEVQLPSGNLKLFAGRGIDFSSQNQSTVGDGTANPTTENEVLQYYEHGTFSPKVTASGVTFDYQGSGGQYGSGHYTRIGDMVFIDINLDSDGSPSGSTGNAVTITNLPFSGNTGCSLNTMYFYRRVSDSSYPHIMCQQYGTAISFLQSPDSGVWRDMPASQVAFVDHRWKVAGCYHIGSI